MLFLLRELTAVKSISLDICLSICIFHQSIIFHSRTTIVQYKCIFFKYYKAMPGRKLHLDGNQY